MKLIPAMIAAMLTAAPLLAVSEPAQALTSRQYAAQGYGEYIPSKGRAPGWRRGYWPRRHYFHRRWQRY
jgi:hypothetical protein